MNPSAMTQGLKIPGEYLIDEGEIALNVGRETLTLTVANTGDRPIQIGSHYHFAETNTALHFDRTAARASGSISPPVPPCASNPGSSARSSWSPDGDRARSTASAAW
jgi:hypothetical protein